MKKVSERLILVAGATGRQGNAVLRHLRARGFPVRALTRDPDKPSARALVGPGTEVVGGDMSDLDSLRSAADGVFGVFSVQPSTDLETEVRQGINLAEAARLQVVDHLVYSSIAGAGLDDNVPHLRAKARVEAHIQLTGLSHTILRPVFFMENWLNQKESIADGTLRFAFQPTTRMQMIAVDDIGALASLAFEHRGRWLGKAMDIAGDEHSMTEIASGFSRVNALPVKYEQLEWGEFERQFGHELTLLLQWFENSGHRADIDQVRAEYKNLSTLERWLNLHWGLARIPVEKKA
jgi:uncharacterized protein YbjT (DUF2867 family)